MFSALEHRRGIGINKILKSPACRDCNLWIFIGPESGHCLPLVEVIIIGIIIEVIIIGQDSEAAFGQDFEV